MAIGIDVRCLLDANLSGVGEYTANILAEFFKKPNEQFVLFSNAFKKDFQLANVGIGASVPMLKSRYPNKLFNIAQVCGLPVMDYIVKSENINHFWLPNLNFFNSARRTHTVTVHDLSFELYPEFYSLKMNLWHRALNPAKLLKKASQIIAVSQNTKADLIKLYNLPADKIKVIYSGISPNFLNDFTTDQLKMVQEKYQLPDKFILFLGTVEPRKNIAGLIEAFEIMKKKGGPRLANWNLVIAGAKGWLSDKLFKRMRKNPQIKYLGYVASDDRPALYKLSSLFVYPSFYEGFGFPPLEAVACKIPVVSSFSGSLGEVLGDAAILVDPYNTNQLAAAMAESLQNPPSAPRLDEISRIIATKFSWPDCASQTLSLLTTNY